MRSVILLLVVMGMATKAVGSDYEIRELKKHGKSLEGEWTLEHWATSVYENFQTDLHKLHYWPGWPPTGPSIVFEVTRGAGSLYIGRRSQRSEVTWRVSFAFRFDDSTLAKHALVSLKVGKKETQYLGSIRQGLSSPFFLDLDEHDSKAFIQHLLRGNFREAQFVIRNHSKPRKLQHLWWFRQQYRWLNKKLPMPHKTQKRTKGKRK